METLLTLPPEAIGLIQNHATACHLTQGEAAVDLLLLGATVARAQAQQRRAELTREAIGQLGEVERADRLAKIAELYRPY